MGSIRHNVLLNYLIGRFEMEIHIRSERFWFYEKLGMHCLDVAYFANCLGLVCIQMLAVVVHTDLT